MIDITDIDDPRISPFKSLRDSTISNNNKIIAESEKVVLKLLNTNIDIEILFASPTFIDSYHDLITKRCDNIYTANRKVMEKIVGHALHHGVMALATRPANVPLKDFSFPCVVLNGLTSAENVGAIIRNCAAFGIKSLLLDSKSCSPYIRRAIRVSMGNVFKIQVRETNELSTELVDLQNRGVNVIATANIQGAQSIHDFKVSSDKYALIIGNEGYGIDEDIISQSTTVLKIPIDDETAAINAACASAVFLYQLRKS